MIVKCQFKQNATKDYGGRMYTYTTDLPLKVGDIVRVPAGDGEGIARVTVTDVPEHTVDANLFRVSCSIIVSCPFALWIKREPGIPILSQFPLATTPSVCISINWYFKEELPELITKTFIQSPH